MNWAKFKHKRKPSEESALTTTERTQIEEVRHELIAMFGNTPYFVELSRLTGTLYRIGNRKMN